MTEVLTSVLASPLVWLLLALFVGVVVVAAIAERPPAPRPSLRYCCPTFTDEAHTPRCQGGDSRG